MTKEPQNNHMDKRLDDDLFTLFSHFLEEQVGLNFGGNNRYLLNQGIFNRVKEIGIRDAREYYQYLKTSKTQGNEFDLLLSEITINETYFFRNQPHFTALKEYALPGIVKRKRERGKRIRIWSAGCSSGEEPYSIAILIKEYLDDLESWNIDIIASDIDRKILGKAREAVYEKRSLKTVSKMLLNRYFEREGHGHRLKNDIRQMVDFRYINLLKPEKAMLSGDKWGIDLIFCRNVLIYFDSDNQKKVLNFFYDCLFDKGILFLGHSETLMNIDVPFIPERYKDAFLYRKVLKQEKTRGIRAKQEKDFKEIGSYNGIRPYPSQVVFNKSGDPGGKRKGVFPQKEKRESAPEKNERRPEEYFNAATNAFDMENFEYAGEQLERFMKSRPNNPEAIFLLARIHLELGDKDMAIGKFLSALKGDPLMEKSRFFLGVIYREMGRVEEALIELGKAIYLNRDFALAYFYRGRIFESESDLVRAIKNYRITIDLLKRESSDEPVELIKGITNAMLLESCERNIRTIAKLRPRQMNS